MELHATLAGAEPAAAGQIPGSSGLELAVETGFRNAWTGIRIAGRTTGRVLFSCQPWKKTARPS